MAEHVLETRLQLRYDTYSNWMNSTVVLKVGEAAIATFPQNRAIEGLSNTKPENTPPAIGMKIGDGRSLFYQLPWVQAIAADVYEWAKTSYKPTYTAQEIQGLQSYVEGLIGGDVEVTIAPRIYQLIQGTNENANKYYLRYKENNEDSNWVVDTSTYIDLSDLVNVVNWIGASNLQNYPNMITRTAQQINTFLSLLVYNDTEVSNQFVTSVTETNGIINVSRARPNFTNLTGKATVEQGGTGRVSLTQDNVLVGNGTDPVKLVPIAESIDNNNHLVPNNLIKAYVDNAVSGLTGAMHFIGEASVVINPNSSVDPRIGGYNFSQVQPGDVILYDAKEFVWTGSAWRLLGDEGSYAVRGSIVNADISDEANIAQSKISGLFNSLDSKVDKVAGKSLTSNDFTDELALKLDGIESGAQRNTIEHILINGTEVTPTTVNTVPNSVDLPIQEFDTDSQNKLAGIAAGAEVNKINKIIFDGNEITPDENKTVNIISDPHTAHENKIESIYVNGTEYAPNANKEVRITIDQAALNLNVLEGAIVPNGLGGTTDIPQVAKKLQLERVAMTGNIRDLNQSNDTYITLYCGSSTDVI